MVTPCDRPAARDFPPRRVVLLGASNLIRGVSCVAEVARQVWGGPLDLLAALGHGRSYGLPATRVLLRDLPGILSCGIWDTLAQRPPAPTATLLTDIGNDIVFGVPVTRITAWVEQTLERVAPFSERIIVTEIPLDSVSRTAPATFLALRSLFFPESRLRFGDALDRAQQLNESIVRLARQFRAAVVKPQPGWYGLDPIHIRYRNFAEAWQQILSAWRDEPASFRYQPSLRRWLVLHTILPHERRMCGFLQRHRQPACKLPDGTWISLY